jgi:hypothetical protein
MSCPRRLNQVTRFCLLLAALLLPASEMCAQSLDPNTPASVRSNTVNGRIAARDLGDARLTDHYYAFTGTPGDLLITVQSQNLNGDIDVFTAGTLRPLLKLTLYAESSAPVTKGIYLRRREDLILRVEARSPNDDEGTYRLFFGGSFEPIVGGPDIAETETPEPAKTETTAGGRKAKRVSSVGARIAEPEPPAEVAAAPTPTPEPTPEAKPVETPKPAEEKAAENPRPSPPRRTSSRRPTPRRTTPRNTETARTPTERPATEARSETRPETTKPEPKPEPPPETGPRLVIETNDGTLINRPMSGVRRVTVERGQVVVVGTDGKIDRFLLANVVRVSIAP